MSDDFKSNPTGALREWFRHGESAGSDLPAPDDELRDLLFFWFLLDCGVCGRIDEFPGKRALVDDDQPNWAWEFARLAVVPARAAGWTAGVDERGFPQAFCPDCSKEVGQARPRETESSPFLLRSTADWSIAPR